MIAEVPRSMRALVLTKIGSPEYLEEQVVPVPALAAEDVLIEVHTVAANHQDVFTLSGRANISQVDLPHIHGIDPAGKVAAVGSAVSGLTLGQRVMTKPSIACGHCKFCVAGHDDACASLRNVGVHLHGGMAEYVAVPSSNVFRIPDTLTFEQATAIAHSFPVALLMLRERASVTAEDVVLVTSASGAIGSASVQLAKILGATVVAAASSPERAAYAAELGADVTVDYGSEPRFADDVRRAFPDGVSVYVESAGNPAVWSEALATLGRRARVTVCGAHAGPIVDLDLKWLFRSRVAILGSSGSSLRGFRDVIELAAAGRLVANIDSVRPLADAAAGFARLMTRQNRGKVILQIATE